MGKLVINTRDYGYKAYLKLKYVTTDIDKKFIEVDTNKSEMEVFREYNSTEFPIYNELLKKLVKG